MLTRQELAQLRQEIVLNSLFTSDYENSFCIHPKQVCDFFDGYVEYLDELEQEDIKEGLQKEPLEFYDFCKKYDTLDNLENWYNCFCDDPLSQDCEYYKHLYNN